MAEARVEILARVRDALERDRTLASGAAATSAPALEEPAGLDDAAARVARFSEVLSGVGGRVHVEPDEQRAAARLETILAELGAREVALSDDGLVRRLAGRLDGARSTFDGWSDRERLFACDAGVSSAQWGIAETGTLVLESSAERHRLVSLVPPVHVAVLRRRSLLAGLGQALRAVRRGETGGPCRAVTLITGPSRTADIELQLVVGVHGPRALHVIVIEEDPA